VRPTEPHAGGLIDLLRNRYDARKLDLLIPVGSEARHSLMAHLEEPFPGVAIALRGIEAREVESFTLHPAVALTFFSQQ
jgi:hypothetical protein